MLKKSIRPLYIIILILLAGTVLCLAVPDQLIHLFSDNTETIVAGRRALRIICIGFAVSGIRRHCRCSGSHGKGIHSLLISCLRYIVLILPLAFIFSHFFGVNGVWHAFWITEVITAVTSGLIFIVSIRQSPDTDFLFLFIPISIHPPTNIPQTIPAIKRAACLSLAFVSPVLRNSDATASWIVLYASFLFSGSIRCIHQHMPLARIGSIACLIFCNNANRLILI